MSWISDESHVGREVQMGHGVIIEPDVFVGDRVKLGHRVTLKSGTYIGDDSVFDDHCISTGACWLGNNVNIRTGAIISKATIVEDWAFIGPGVVTNHTKHVSHGRPEMLDQQLVTYIGYGSIVGSQASLLAGVVVDPLSIIGGGSVVVADIDSLGVYFGSPAKQAAMVFPEEYRMNLPLNAGHMYQTEEIETHLRRFMPNLKGFIQ